MQFSCLHAQMRQELSSAQVVKGDGITAMLTGPDSQIAAEPSIDSSAVKDSMDTLAGIAVSSQEGRTVCLESSAGPAACSALQVHLCPSEMLVPEFSGCQSPPFMRVWPVSAVLQTV